MIIFSWRKTRRVTYTCHPWSTRPGTRHGAGGQKAEDRHIKVLLIENNPEHTKLIREQLAKAEEEFDLEQAEDLSGGLNKLERGQGFDLVLLDLALPDSKPAAILDQVRDRAPGSPLLVLAPSEERAAAETAVKEGAQDYILTEELSRDILPRSMRYAMERHRLRSELQALTLTDELTGLYNRRGFIAHAGQQLTVAPRLDRDALLLYLDLDNTRWINENFGRAEGDKALTETALILGKTFRRADVLARVGGDEFAALALFKRGDDPDYVIRRLHAVVERRNSTETNYALSFSLGVLKLDTRGTIDVEQVLAEADARMREERSAGAK